MISKNNNYRPFALKPQVQEISDCITTRFPIRTERGETLIQYRMIDTKTGKCVGEMLGFPVTEKPRSNFYPILKEYDSFKIDTLKVFERAKGYGTKLVQLAKRESERFGCQGRVHLIASNMYDNSNPPHIFYRKMNFTSQDKLAIKCLDECIRNKEQIRCSIFSNIPMFLAENDNLAYAPKTKLYSRYLKIKLKTLLSYVKI